MGNTGIETTEIVSAVTQLVKPNVVIVIDSLMSKSIDRVGSSIQISNTGITPGSGITGINSIIDENSLNAKVISVGVPMVVDIATIANEIMDKVDKDYSISNERYNKIKEALDMYNNYTPEQKTQLPTYIQRYCAGLVYDERERKFEISNERTLSLLLNGLCQRYYTTEISNEKKVALATEGVS